MGTSPLWIGWTSVLGGATSQTSSVLYDRSCRFTLEMSPFDGNFWFGSFFKASYFQFYSPSSGAVPRDVPFFKKSHWCCNFTGGYHHLHEKNPLNFAQWRYTNQWPYREVVLLLVENWIPIPRLEDVKYHLSCQFLMVLLETNWDVAKTPGVTSMLCFQLHTKYIGTQSKMGKEWCEQATNYRIST